MLAFEFSYQSAHNPATASMNAYAEAYLRLEDAGNGTFHYVVLSIEPTRLVLREWADDGGAPAAPLVVFETTPTDATTLQGAWYDVRIDYTASPNRMTVSWAGIQWGQSLI